MVAKKKQESKKENENKTAFIIAPIGKKDSDARRKIDGLIESVIQPVLDKFDLKALASHKISKSGSINKQIIEHLVNDKLVICNLTGLNPNVMYELAIRHAVMLPSVLIAEQGTKNPFDLFGERTIPFVDDIKGVSDLMPKLRSAIEETLEDKKPDNPISRVIGFESILKEAAVSGDGLPKYMVEEMAEMKQMIFDLSRLKTLISGEVDLAEFMGQRELETLARLDLTEKAYVIEGSKENLLIFKELAGKASFAITTMLNPITNSRLYWRFRIDENAMSRLYKWLRDVRKQYPDLTIESFRI